MNLKFELRPFSIKEWNTRGKNGKIGPYLAELVIWLPCKISFFTIYNHTNGAADMAVHIVHIFLLTRHLEYS